MNYESHILTTIWIMLAAGVALSILQLIINAKVCKYWFRLTVGVSISSVIVASLLAGEDFATYAAYDFIRSNGFFYADMFMDGIDTAASGGVSDVLALMPNIALICFCIWFIFTVLGAFVVSAIIGFVFELASKVAFDQVFVAMIPVAVMTLGSALLSNKVDFNEGALSNRNQFHQLNISLPIDEIKALDEVCPSDTAIYDRYKITCDGEDVASIENSFFSVPYSIVVVWSDDLQRQSVIVRASENSMSLMHSRSKVTHDAEEAVRKLNAALKRDTQNSKSDDDKKKEWANAELFPDRK